MRLNNTHASYTNNNAVMYHTTRCSHSPKLGAERRHPALRPTWNTHRSHPGGRTSPVQSRSGGASFCLISRTVVDDWTRSTDASRCLQRKFFSNDGRAVVPQIAKALSASANDRIVSLQQTAAGQWLQRHRRFKILRERGERKDKREESAQLQTEALN